MSTTNAKFLKIIKKFPHANNSRELAFKVLFEIYAMDAFSDISISRNFNQIDFDNNSKSLAAAYIYGTLTETIALDELISEFSKVAISKLDMRVLTILRLGLWQIYYSNELEHAAVSETVKLCRKFGITSATSLVNAILRKSIRVIEPSKYDAKSIYAKTGFNQEIFNLFLNILGNKEEIIKLANAFRENPKLNVRIRALSSEISQKSDKFTYQNKYSRIRDNLYKNLDSNGVTHTDSSFQNDSIYLYTNGKSLHSLDAWKSGQIIAQGESAMLPAIALNPKTKEYIADLCAAPGGKSIQLADISNDKARILANDIQNHRVELINKNVNRLNIKSIETRISDASQLEEWIDYKEAFDKVLADVPCSGLGLINSKPELRFKFSNEKIKRDILPIQSNILNVAEFILKPGGVLVYSTCTLNPDENEKQIEKFLARHKNFQLLSLKSDYANLFDNKLLYKLDSQLNSGMLTVWPQELNSEGFFIAKLQKSK